MNVFIGLYALVSIPLAIAILTIGHNTPSWSRRGLPTAARRGGVDLRNWRP